MSEFEKMLNGYLDGDKYSESLKPVHKKISVPIDETIKVSQAEKSTQSEILKLQFESMLSDYLDDGGKNAVNKSQNTRNSSRSQYVPVLDVHGCTKLEADAKLNDMLQMCSIKKLKRFRLVYGKGTHSHNNQSVLRTYLRQKLDDNPNIKKLDPCLPKDGGWGAVWVILM